MIPRLSLVIPCYNEALNLEALIKLCDQSLAQNNVEVILVDNGSVDNTQEILKTLLPKYPFIKTCHVKQNQGYGYGILQGLEIASANYIGWSHADLQTNPADVLPALEIIKNNPQQDLFIKGTRYGRSLSDVFFTIGMSIFNTIILGTRLSDINAQPNIFPKSFFKKWQNPPHDFSLDLYVYYLAKKHKLILKRIPVYFGKRVAGEAHLKNLKAKIKYSLKSINYTLSIRNKM